LLTLTPFQLEPAAASGAAVLYALRPVAAEEELLLSYRDATADGALEVAEGLQCYGFLSLAPEDEDEVGPDPKP
jgi:hypothetical protein